MLTTNVLCALGLGLGLALSGCLDPAEPGNLVTPTVDDDPDLPRIEIGNTVLHAEAFGDPAAPMIVVLHGGPGGDYRALLPYQVLADDGYRVVFWDQRGAGLSRRQDLADYTMDGYLEDLRLVIEHYTTSPEQPVVLFGHSWGAMYATWFIDTYGTYGGRVRGAIISEPGAFTKAGLEDFQSANFPPWGFTSEQLNDVAWADQFMSDADHERADYLVQVGALAGNPKFHFDPNNETPTWRFGAIVQRALMKLALDRGFDWTTHLGEFPHPVIFLRGELSEYMSIAHQSELASHYADAEVITIPGAGHHAYWEKYDEYLAQVRAYLEGRALVGGVR